jgi:Zn-dependent peptidase ImmA (M78 family)
MKKKITKSQKAFALRILQEMGDMDKKIKTSIQRREKMHQEIKEGERGGERGEWIRESAKKLSDTLMELAKTRNAQVLDERVTISDLLDIVATLNHSLNKKAS